MLDANVTQAPVKDAGLERITAEDVLAVIEQRQQGQDDRLWELDKRVRSLEEPRKREFEWELERRVKYNVPDANQGESMPRLESLASRLRRARGG